MLSTYIHMSTGQPEQGGTKALNTGMFRCRISNPEHTLLKGILKGSVTRMSTKPALGQYDERRAAHVITLR